MQARLRLVFATLLFTTALGCGDGSGPRPFDAAFSLVTVNGSPPPVLVAATVSCDEYLDSALLNFMDDGTFVLSAQITLDCTAVGGAASPQQLSISGTYTRSGATITLQVPGATAIRATYHGSTLTGTIPASSVTFPNPLDVVFSRLLPLSE